MSFNYDYSVAGQEYRGETVKDSDSSRNSAVSFKISFIRDLMSHHSSYQSRKRFSSKNSSLQDASKNDNRDAYIKNRKNECNQLSERKESRSKTQHRRRLRRKTSLYWDVPAPGFENMTTAEYKELLKNGQALESVSACSRQVLVPVLSATITRQARRLYIGNIPFGVTEEEMIMFFNSQMHLLALSQAKGYPVLACQINLEKSFAFVEFRSIDETTQAMALDGINFQGMNLKVRRPHDYQPLPGEAEKTPTPIYGTSNVVPDSPNKIFIGGLPNFLTDDQVKELLQSFGELRGFNLIKDQSTGLNKGYAFCEYMNPDLTNLAISSLNGMFIGERRISVQRAISSSKSSTESSVSRTTALFNSSKQEKDEATEILCLLNMVTYEDLADDEEFDDILSDVKDECANYGIVRSIEIPRPIGDQIVQGCGKIFVQFNSIYDCQRAQQAISGRKFNGRTVITSYYDSEKFHRRDFN